MKVSGIVVSFVLLSLAVGKRDPTQRRDRNRHSGRRAIQEDGDTDSNVGQCELEITCKGDTSATSTPVKLPIRGPRGPSGKQGDRGAAGEPGIPGTPGVPGKSAKEVEHVAFFVGIGDNIGPIEGNIDLIFDKVVTNVGDAYSAKTGRFTAPFSGTFQFTVVVAAQGRQKAAATLVKNGAMIATIWAESIPYWATASNTAILNLRSGDQVWLVLLKRAPYVHGYMYTSFSGYVLFGEVKNDNSNRILDIITANSTSSTASTPPV